MADQNFCAAAIDATSRSTNTYIKFLSANDTGLTGGHQSGILLSKKTARSLGMKARASYASLASVAVFLT